MLSQVPNRTKYCFLSKIQSSTAWAASGEQKPVLSSFILSFFIRFVKT